MFNVCDEFCQDMKNFLEWWSSNLFWDHPDYGQYIPIIFIHAFVSSWANKVLLCKLGPYTIHVSQQFKRKMLMHGDNSALKSIVSKANTVLKENFQNRSEGIYDKKIYCLKFLSTVMHSHQSSKFILCKCDLCQWNGYTFHAEKSKLFNIRSMNWQILLISARWFIVTLLIAILN